MIGAGLINTIVQLSKSLDLILSLWRSIKRPHLLPLTSLASSSTDLILFLLTLTDTLADTGASAIPSWFCPQIHHCLSHSTKITYGLPPLRVRIHRSREIDCGLMGRKMRWRKVEGWSLAFGRWRGWGKRRLKTRIPTSQRWIEVVLSFVWIPLNIFFLFRCSCRRTMCTFVPTTTFQLLLGWLLQPLVSQLWYLHSRFSTNYLCLHPPCHLSRVKALGRPADLSLVVS